MKKNRLKHGEYLVMTNGGMSTGNVPVDPHRIN